MPFSNINIHYTNKVSEGAECSDVVLFTVNQKHRIHNNRIKQFDKHYEIMSPVAKTLDSRKVHCCLLKSLSQNTHRIEKIGIYGLTDTDGYFSFPQLKQIYDILNGKLYTPNTQSLLRYLTTEDYPIDRETTLFYPFHALSRQSIDIETNWLSVFNGWVGDIIFLN